MTPSGVRSMLRQNVAGQQAATLACMGRNAAQQTGDAIGGTERPQSLGVGRTEQTPGGNRDTAGTTEQVGAPVLCGLERRLRLGLACIDQRQQVAAIEIPGLDRDAQRFGDVVAAVRRLRPPRATIAAGSAPAAAPTLPRAPAPARD